RAQFDELLARQHARLSVLYGRDDLTPERMRIEKAAAFERIREEYRTIREQWDGGVHFDSWFARVLNNADVLSLATYRQWLSAVERLLEVSADLDQFFLRAENLAVLDPPERRAQLAALLGEPGVEQRDA